MLFHFGSSTELQSPHAARPQLRCLNSKRDLNLDVNQGQPVCVEKLNGLVGFAGGSCCFTTLAMEQTFRMMMLMVFIRDKMVMLMRMGNCMCMSHPIMSMCECMTVKVGMMPHKCIINHKS